MEYETIMSNIIEETGLSAPEVEQLVKDKIAELKGLITKEGAIFVIAKELKVNTNNKNKNKKEVNKMEKMEDGIITRVEDLKAGEFITFQGKVTKIEDVKQITTRKGDSVNLLNIHLTDETNDGIRVTAWRDKATELSNTLKSGMVILLVSVKVQWSDYSNKYELVVNDKSGVVIGEEIQEEEEEPREVDFGKLMKGQELPPLPKIELPPKDKPKTWTVDPNVEGIGGKLDTIIELLTDIKHSMGTITGVMTKDIEPELKTADGTGDFEWAE